MEGEGISWFFRGLHASRSGLDPDTVDRILRARILVEQGYPGPLELADLARAACYSRYHFLRLFEQAYGETPGRFLQQRRLREARRLLCETDLPVTDVSLRVGFRSLGSFSRTFREQTGLAPAKYRRTLFLGIDPPRSARIPCCFLARFSQIAIPEKRAAGTPA